MHFKFLFSTQRWHVLRVEGMPNNHAACCKRIVEQFSYCHGCHHRHRRHQCHRNLMSLLRRQWRSSLWLRYSDQWRFSLYRPFPASTAHALSEAHTCRRAPRGVGATLAWATRTLRSSWSNVGPTGGGAGRGGLSKGRRCGGVSRERERSREAMAWCLQWQAEDSFGHDSNDKTSPRSALPPPTSHPPFRRPPAARARAAHPAVRARPAGVHTAAKKARQSIGRLIPHLSAKSLCEIKPCHNCGLQIQKSENRSINIATGSKLCYCLHDWCDMLCTITVCTIVCVMMLMMMKKNMT